MILFKAQAASPPPCHITDKDFVTDGVSSKYSQFRKKKKFSFATLGLVPWESVVLYSPVSLAGQDGTHLPQEAAGLGPPRLVHGLGKGLGNIQPKAGTAA